MNKFIDQGLKIRPQLIESVVRLGRYNDQKVRPIMVTFCSKVNQITVIDNLSALKTSNEEYKMYLSVLTEMKFAEAS